MNDVEKYALYSVRMWKNTDQKNSEYEYFSRSESDKIQINNNILLTANFLKKFLKFY